MFEDSLVVSGPLLRTRNRWPAVLSVAAQCTLALLLASLSLLHPELIQLPHPAAMSLALPHPPAPTPPPVKLPSHAVARSAAATLPVTTAADVPRTTGCACHGLTLSGPGVSESALGAINLSGDHGGPLGIGPAPAGPRVAVEAPKAGPLKVSSGVLSGFLLAPIRPSYPQIARIAHIEGDVLIDAVISRTGTIESARVLRGPVMLQAATLAAVESAHYRPFLLNGQPTAVQTSITIVFRMSP